MGQGMYVICEWDSVLKENSLFRQSLIKLEQRAIKLCTERWFPTKTMAQAFGGLTPQQGNQFGRTTILPALFQDWTGTVMNTVAGGGDPDGTWRQLLTTTGQQTLLRGSRTGAAIPEDFVVSWAGLALPNKNQHITELKWQIGSRKYGRIDIEELLGYNKPAIIFEEGFELLPEESFHLYGLVEGPLPTAHDGYVGVHQWIIPLGAAYYKIISKVLTACCSAI